MCIVSTGVLGLLFSGSNDATLCLSAQAASPGRPAQAIKRELLGTCAIKNAIWSLKMRRLRKMKSSHKLGT
jgi:hypothetical protein